VVAKLLNLSCRSFAYRPQGAGIGEDPSISNFRFGSILLERCRGRSRYVDVQFNGARRISGGLQSSAGSDVHCDFFRIYSASDGASDLFHSDCHSRFLQHRERRRTGCGWVSAGRQTALYLDKRLARLVDRDISARRIFDAIHPHGDRRKNNVDSRAFHLAAPRFGHGRIGMRNSQKAGQQLDLSEIGRPPSGKARSIFVCFFHRRRRPGCPRIQAFSQVFRRRECVQYLIDMQGRVFHSQFIIRFMGADLGIEELK
jgi:hypothetical protein